MPNPFQPIIAPPAAEVSAADKLVKSGNDMLATLARQYQDAYRLLWNNPKATPDKIVAALGNQAGQLFSHAAALGSFLTAQGATVPGTPAGWTVTVNADGTATAVKTPPVVPNATTVPNT